MKSVLDRAVAAAIAQRMDRAVLALAAAGTPVDFSAQIEVASKAVADAAEFALNHYNVVRQNNLAKTVAEVLSRDDVVLAFTEPFRIAENAVKAAVSAAWDAGVETGAKEAEDQLQAIGLHAVGQGATPETLAQILSDVTANATAARERLSAALVADQDPQVVADDLARRAGLSVDAAGVSGRNEAKAATYSTQEGVGKTWVTHFNPGTCEHCANLHGVTVGIDQQFPHDTGARDLPVYGGTLFGPPRHPNCRCSLAPFHPQVKASVGPASMQGYALTQAAKKDAHPPATISAASVRTMQKGALATVLAWLLRKLGG